jgi:hypothetical protein
VYCCNKMPTSDTKPEKKSLSVKWKIFIGFVALVVLVGIIVAILNAAGVTKTHEEIKESSNPTQNNVTDVNVKTNSKFEGSANSSQDNLSGSSADPGAAVPAAPGPGSGITITANEQLKDRLGFTIQVDATDSLQKSVFKYYTSDNRLKGPMPEYVALNGSKFVKFQGRECVSWRTEPISDAEKAEMVNKGVTTEIAQQLESCSIKEYCVGLYRRGDVYSLCTTDDVDDKFIPQNCLKRNSGNDCIEYEEGATHMGYNQSGTWMLESEMKRGGLSGDINVPMRREIFNNNMEYLQLRDYDRQRFKCTETIPTITGNLQQVIAKCSSYDSPPGGCRAVMKTETDYIGCKDIDHVTMKTYDPSFSKFIATPALVTTGQVTHVFNERLMEMSSISFNIADKFYYNRNHADFDPELTTNEPGWSDAVLDL